MLLLYSCRYITFWVLGWTHPVNRSDLNQS